jgi:hypothetical protein
MPPRASDTSERVFVFFVFFVSFVSFVCCDGA